MENLKIFKTQAKSAVTDLVDTLEAIEKCLYNGNREIPANDFVDDDLDTFLTKLINYAFVGKEISNTIGDYIVNEEDYPNEREDSEVLEGESSLNKDIRTLLEVVYDIERNLCHIGTSFGIVHSDEVKDFPETFNGKLDRIMYELNCCQVQAENIYDYVAIIE